MTYLLYIFQRYREIHEIDQTEFPKQNLNLFSIMHHPFEFSKEYWITRKFVSIPGHIINYMKNVTKSSDPHINRYFMRAFTRWMFNVIKNGKNPFCEIITSKDLIIEKDIDYFFSTRTLTGVDTDSSSTSPKRPKLDWTWLDEKLKNIQRNFDPSMKVKQILIRVEVDEIVEMTGEQNNPQYPRQIVFYDIEDATFKISKKQYKLALSRFRKHSVTRKKWSKEDLSCNASSRERLDTAKPHFGLGVLPKENFTNIPEMLNEYLAILVSRYICIGTTNNHCSVPPFVIEYCGIRTELFGSPLNTSVEQYCSPMIDIEKHFGSLGSFFDFNMCSGTYLLNPPYDESIINESMEKIFNVLTSSKEITVIVVLPIWDIETQAIFDHIPVSNKEPSRKDSFKKSKNLEFPIIPVIKKNKYTRSHYLLGCHTHKFFNFYIDGYLPMADTHLFVLSNTVYNLTAQQIANVWQSGLNDGAGGKVTNKRNSW